MTFSIGLRPILVQIALASNCLAFQFITKNTLPANNLSAGCITALTADISNCPRQVGNFPTRSYYDVDALEEACTADCAASLAKYNTATAGACGTQDVYNVSSSHVAPVSFVPTLLHYYYNKTCIQDGDRWCNRVALEMSDANATSSNFRSMSVGNETVAGNGSAEAIPFPNISKYCSCNILEQVILAFYKSSSTSIRTLTQWLQQEDRSKRVSTCVTIASSRHISFKPAHPSTEEMHSERNTAL